LGVSSKKLINRCTNLCSIELQALQVSWYVVCITNLQQSNPYLVCIVHTILDAAFESLVQAIAELGANSPKFLSNLLMASTASSFLLLCEGPIASRIHSAVHRFTRACAILLLPARNFASPSLAPFLLRRHQCLRDQNRVLRIRLRGGPPRH
jgi:hypothetical protein